MTVENHLQEAGVLATLSWILAGWMHSNAVGIATTVFSLITMCLTTWVMFSAITVFM